MKLSDCKYGVLVQTLEQFGEIGMVVGITNNIPTVLSEEQKNPERAIPMIQWQSGRTFGINHHNIREYKG
jgi:hypothetical protein